MKRSAVCFLLLAVAGPVLRAQQPDLDVVQTRRAFVAAVNIGAIDVIAGLLADDAMLRTDARTGPFMENAPAAPSPTQVSGRDAVIAYFKREFASGRMKLVAQASDQSDAMATESGKLQFLRVPFNIGVSTEGQYRIALVRTDEGWRITDVQFASEGGTRRSVPDFNRRPPVVPQPRPAPPPRREPLPPPRFGIVPLVA
jgi:hypothetical protein